MAISKVTLDIVQESVKRHISQQELQLSNFSVEETIDRLSQDMVITLTRKRPMQDLGAVSVQVPATWFQHFKLSYFPDFLLKKYPARFDIVKVGASAFYDKIAMPDRTTQFKVSVLEGVEHTV